MGGQSLCCQPVSVGPGQAGGCCTSPVTCDLSPPPWVLQGHAELHMREGPPGWSVCPCASKALPHGLDASSPGWHIPGQRGWAGSMGAGGACPSVPSDPRALDWGRVSPCLGGRGVGRPCCSISGRPLGSASSPEGSALLLRGCQGFQLNFLAPLKPATLCAFFNTAKHLKRCLLLFL